MSKIEKMYENCNFEKSMGVGSPLALHPFTEEKQLNLIIFLANRGIRISPAYISSGYYLNDLSKIKSSRNIFTFENSLAQHINAIWQDLTEEEKQQVKGILE